MKNVRIDGRRRRSLVVPVVLAVGVLALLPACGDEPRRSNGHASKESWRCVWSSEVYCTCTYTDGNLLLADDQVEVDACGPGNVEAPAICYAHGEESCQCATYECGQDPQGYGCGCGFNHGAIFPSDIPVASCADDYCCVQSNSEFCFCGISPCEPGETPVAHCEAGAVLAVLAGRGDDPRYPASCPE